MNRWDEGECEFATLRIDAFRSAMTQSIEDIEEEKAL